jgi:excisionase family DNA binding protein
MNETTAAILANPACTPREVRLLLRSGKNTIYAAIKSGEIPSFRIGHSIRIPTSWLRDKLGIPPAA